MIFSRKRKELAFDEMQVREACLQEVKKHCDLNKKTGRFDQQKCLDIASEEFNRQYRAARGYRKSHPLDADDMEELNGLRARMWDSVAEEARKMALDYATEYKARQITQTTAGGYIRSALSEAGFADFYVTCQCYRAKVTVIMPSRYRMMFIVRYKDIMAGKMESILEQFISLTRSVEALPFQVKIWK